MLEPTKGRTKPVRISWKRSAKVKVVPHGIEDVARTSLSGVEGARTHIHMSKRFLTSSADNPATLITFVRLLAPDAMVTEERGTFKSFARKSVQASLARPPTGGAVNESLSASPTSPVIAFFLARGWTLIVKVTPDSLSWIGSIERLHHRVTETQRNRTEFSKKPGMQAVPLQL